MKLGLKDFLFCCGCVLLSFIMLTVPVLCVCSFVYDWDGVVKFILFVMTGLDVVSLAIYFISSNYNLGG